MDEREREYFAQQIQLLEQAKRRWKLATLATSACLVIFLAITGAGNAVQYYRCRVLQQEAETQRQRAEHNLDLAREAVDKLYTEIAERMR